jgi:hypothetical protein
MRLVASSIVVSVLALCVPALANAGTKYQANLTPDEAADMPGFTANGSSIKIDDRLRAKGKIKRIVDDQGALVTTDPLDGNDDYWVEIELHVLSTDLEDTVTIFFDVKNGNAKFSADLSADPVFAGAIMGDGVEVDGVRVYSPTDEIGRAGIAIR